MPGLFFLMIVVGGAFWWFENPDLHEQAKQVGMVAAAVGVVYLGYRKARGALALSRHGRLFERLRAFAASLTNGQVAGAGFFEGGTARITGTYEGLRLQLEADFGDDPAICYELIGVDSSNTFEAERAPLLLRLVSGDPIRYPTPIVERRGGPELALRTLLGDLGITRVTLNHGVLRAQGPASEDRLTPDALFTVYRELGRIARVYRRPQRPTPSRRLRSGSGGRGRA